ncbi:MAG TPA: NAD(+) diphosphatase [Propionicimonas sp.]|nr:NAD(+) diphosphatase [Propionicimonas sp.]HRA05008.1 NAD(+) diphosphatase [Propionicimonas sp.]
MNAWLTESALDRVEEARTDALWVRSLWSSPDAMVLAAQEAQVSADASGLVPRPARGDFDPEQHHLLGLVAGRPWFATAAESGPVPLRSVMDGFGPTELQLAFTAAGLVGWHTRSRFCPNCGAATITVAAGMARRCSGCEQEHYPRTDPAVIVAILDSSDRLLLGRQPVWPAGRHSVFAGFVEVGESLEQAVHREMAEEVGLRLHHLSYLGSQPWPFPRSLMVAFVGHADDTELTLASEEIEGARWFTRDQLRAALDVEVTLPYAASIARRMIDSWLDGRLT